MRKLKIIWIVHRAAIVTAGICAVLMAVCSFCSAMVGYEQGQFSVVSGQVNCVMMTGEFVCEEKRHEHN